MHDTRKLLLVVVVVVVVLLLSVEVLLRKFSASALQDMKSINYCYLFIYLFIFTKGRSYGQRRPPLTHILRSILERYPDGGQILKVCISCGILDFQQQLSLVTSLKRRVEDINMEVIFFAKVIHPKQAAAILDFKRGWTGINNILVCARSFSNLDFSAHSAAV